HHSGCAYNRDIDSFHIPSEFLCRQSRIFSYNVLYSHKNLRDKSFEILQNLRAIFEATFPPRAGALNPIQKYMPIMASFCLIFWRI
ncbi:MAG: hypothetical protein IJ226_01725, partial [Clostridia bacterium]|nr:hypothetical protein [Clostridia bacterium]